MKILFGELKQCLFCWLLAQKGHKISKSMQPEETAGPIDFVVTWVDGSDPAWKARKEEYQRKIGIFKEHRDNGEERFRDWGLFRYWFRAVETYAPWVRNVYLITEGHVPEWLNLECPKLKHIRHSDFIPEEYLPTFNSNVIELNMHRIEGLSEHFVYFNDDMFLTRPCKPEDFFSGGNPNATAIAVPVENTDNGAFSHINFSTLGVINGIYEGKANEIIKKDPQIWFHHSYGYPEIHNKRAFRLESIQGMYFSHCPTAFRKSTFAEMWEVFPSFLKDTSSHRFRTPQDIMHHLVTIWEIMNARVNPVSMAHHGRCFSRPATEVDQICSSIQGKKNLAICINDSEYVSYEDFVSLKEQIRDTMQTVFPEKSSFEK